MVCATLPFQSGLISRATNGQKSKTGTNSDLLDPHILRAICNVKVVKVLTGSAANYAVIFDSMSIGVELSADPSQWSCEDIRTVTCAGLRSEHYGYNLRARPAQNYAGFSWTSERCQVCRWSRWQDPPFARRQYWRCMGLRQQRPGPGRSRKSS